jgi:hypothetical protein
MPCRRTAAASVIVGLGVLLPLSACGTARESRDAAIDDTHHDGVSSVSVHAGPRAGTGLPVAFVPPDGWHAFSAWAINTLDGHPTFETRDYWAVPENGVHNAITVCVEVSGQTGCDESAANLVQVVHGGHTTAVVSVLPRKPAIRNDDDLETWRSVELTIS